MLQLNSLSDTSVMACDKRTIKVYGRAPTRFIATAEFHCKNEFVILTDQLSPQLHACTFIIHSWKHQIRG